MSLTHNGLTVTEHVALHSDGTREFDYTLEDAILPRSIVLAIIGLSMGPDVEIINDCGDVNDLYYNHQASIIQEIFNGFWSMRVDNQCDTVYQTDHYEFVFSLSEDKKELECKVTWYPCGLDKDTLKFNKHWVEPCFTVNWTIDELDSIDAINWQAGQCFDELIGNV